MALERVKDPTATLDEIGRRAGYKSSPRQKAWDALQDKGVKNEVERLMDKEEGLRMPSLLKKLNEGLDAKDTKFFQEKGVVKDTRDVVAWGERRQYLGMALELRGALRGNKDPNQAPMSLELFLGKSGAPEDRDRMADTFIAIRVRRGLHPIENRSLNSSEAAQWAKGTE